MIYLIKRIAKIVLICLSVFCIIFLAAALLVYQLKIPQKIIQQKAEIELSKALNRRVQFGEISGDLITRLKIMDLQIADDPKVSSANLLQIKEVTLHYNPIKILLKQQDLLAAITKIYLTGGTLNVLCNTTNTWNVLLLLPTQNANIPITFKGKIYYSDLKVTYSDSHGWGPKLLEKPFTTIFSQATGSLDFKYPKKVKIKANGLLENKTNFSVNGVLNIVSLNYMLNFNAPCLDLDYWGSYVFPIEGFLPYKNSVAVSGKIKSKPNFNWLTNNKELPFTYKLMITMKNNALTVPFFPVPVTNIYARMLLADDKVLFKHLEGQTNNIPFKGVGWVDLKKSKIIMNLKATDFEIAHIKALFPQLGKLDLAGKGSSTIKISNDLFTPQIDGKFTSNYNKIYGIGLDKIKASYQYRKPMLNLKLLQANIFSGNAQGELSLNLATGNSELTSALLIKNLNLKQVWPEQAKQITGNVDINLSLNGKSTDYNLNLEITAKNTFIYNQKLINFALQAQAVNQNDIVIKKGELHINDSKHPITFTGNVLNFKNYKIDFTAINIPFAKLTAKILSEEAIEIPERGFVEQGELQAKGQLWGEVNDAFIKDPASQLNFSLDGQASSVNVGSLFFSNIGLKLDYLKGQLNLKKFIGKHNEMEITCEGNFHKTTPQNIVLRTKKFNLNTLAFLQKIIPDALKPMTGICDLTATIKHLDTRQVNQELKASYAVTAEANLENLSVRNQSIKKAHFLLAWNGKNLKLSNILIEQEKSKIYLNAELNQGQQFKLTILNNTYIDLSEFNILTAPFGVIQGKGKIAGDISGAANHLTYNLNLDLTEPRYNYLIFNKITGNTNYTNNKILSLNSLVLEKNKDQYLVNSQIDLTDILAGLPMHLNKLDFSLYLKINNGNLDSLSDILENFYQEVQTKLETRRIAAGEVIKSANVKIAVPIRFTYSLEDLAFTQGQVSLFSLVNPHNSLAFYNKVNQQQLELLKPRKVGFKDLWRGGISGWLHLDSHKTNFPIITADIQLNNAQIAFLQAGNLHFTAAKQNMLTAINLDISSANIMGKSIDKLTCAANLIPNGDLIIRKNNLIMDGSKTQDVLIGTIPLALLWDKTASENINLNITLKDNNISLLSIFNKNIQTIQNQGILKFNLSGRFFHPLINSEKISLKNTKIFFTNDTFFRSPLCVTENNSLVLINNRLTIPDLHVTWQGADTKDHLNELDILGQIEMFGLKFPLPEQMTLDMELALKNTLLSLNLDNIYNGELEVKDCLINGRYIIPISEEAIQKANEQAATIHETGPLVRAQISLQNGVVAFPKLGVSKLKPFFLLDIEGYVKKNILIEGSLFGNDILAGIANTFTLRLDESTEKISISGSLNAPKIDAGLSLAEGSVNLLNRTFTLMSSADQANYYSSEGAKVKPNILTFTNRIPNSSSDKISLMPVLNLKAVTELRPIAVTVNAAEADSQKARNVVVIFNGPIYELSSVSFESFLPTTPSDPKTKMVPEDTYVLVNSGKENNNPKIAKLLNLLMPDLLMNTGSYIDDISKNGLNGEKAKQLFNELGARQLDLWTKKTLIRPFERSLVQKIGFIDDLQFNYNLNYYGQEEKLLGIVMAKNITDRVILRTVTNMDARFSGGPTKVTEVEILYYLLRNLSVNFANVRDYQENDFHPKFSIKGSYEF